MPILKTVSVSYERKINMESYGGNKFESMAVSCTLWADVEPGESEDQAMQQLWAMAKENVKAQVAPVIAELRASMVNAPGGGGNGRQPKSYFLGLPVEQQKGV